VKMLEAGI